TCSIYLLFSYYIAPHALHSFPTRRSSDLRQSPRGSPVVMAQRPPCRGPGGNCGAVKPGGTSAYASGRGGTPRVAAAPAPREHRRSEEHTSELQSRSDLVCRLLLEKKKRKK